MQKQIHYLFVGYAYAGKSTLARELETRLGFNRISIDEVKFDLGFKDVSDSEISAEDWHKIFTELDKRIRNFLTDGKSLLNEYAWMTREWRDRAREIATSMGVETKIIFVDTPEKIIRKRWEENKKTKERFHVAVDVFEDSIRLFEPPSEDENLILYKNDMDVSNWIKENID